MKENNADNWGGHDLVSNSKDSDMFLQSERFDDRPISMSNMVS